jgi:hypothetical protein
MSILEGVLIAVVIILLIYIYFRGMPPSVEIRTDNGKPVELLNVSSAGDLAKLNPTLNQKREYKPVYFPNGYIFRIGPVPTPDGSPYVSIMG